MSTIPPPYGCTAVIFTGRSKNSGGRSGMIPPRRCYRPVGANGRYCPVHAVHADVQDLYNALVPKDLEAFIERWNREKKARFAAQEEAVYRRFAPPLDKWGT